MVAILSRPQCVKTEHQILAERPIAITVFETACQTGAQDQQKQHRSSKTTVYAGPKDQQLVLFFRNSHCPNIVPNTLQSSKE